MRDYLLRVGKYKGIHQVFENADEFHKSYPKVKLWRWAVDECQKAEQGDWVQAEDGYITQILYITYWDKNPKKRPTFVFRFPMGSFTIFQKKDGSWKYRSFYGMFTVPHRNSAGQTFSISKSTGPKLRFAALIMAGVPLTKALRIAYPDYRITMTPQQIFGKIKRLLMDEVVKHEVSEIAQGFKDKIIKNVAGQDEIIAKIKQHWEEVKPGSSQELSAIKFMMEINDVLVQDETGKRKKIANIEDAKYTEEENRAAPQLGEPE